MILTDLESWFTMARQLSRQDRALQADAFLDWQHRTRTQPFDMAFARWSKSKAFGRPDRDAIRHLAAVALGLVRAERKAVAG